MSGRSPLGWLLRGVFAPILLLAAQRGAAQTPASPDSANAPPAFLIGAFEDDYDGSYRVSAALWQHGSRARYHIIKWNVGEQYLIARNDDNNPGDQGLFTRIDWIRFDMTPYTWAFCMSAFKAPTAEAAEATRIVNRENPRAGCNGFPFSRMKPASP